MQSAVGPRTTTAADTTIPARRVPPPSPAPPPPAGPDVNTTHLLELQRTSASHSEENTSPREDEPPSISPESVLKQQPLPTPEPTRQLLSSKVPSSRIGRLFHYGGLAASLSYGAASEMVRRTAQGSDGSASSSLMMTEANIGRLVAKLSQMRGAALKLGQFMSIQDTHVLPPDLDAVLRRVQDAAHYMPDAQFENAMRQSLGDDWMSNFASFERIPFAAASIGQVHRAELKASAIVTAEGTIPVAVKVQFPNIARSIASDLGYLRTLLTAGRLLPKGLFLNKTLEVMKGELADECDYTREADMARKFAGFVKNDDRFKVPWVWSRSSKEVLVMERVNGISIGDESVKQLPQERKNDLAARIIELCLRELFTWRTMQTDPNWSNFLWDGRSGKIQLVDFGATREYDKQFMDSWLRLLQAAASGDREACIRWSLKVGYLTGEENELMLDAHARSMTLLAMPFRDNTPMPISFGPSSSWADITAQIRALIPVMLQNRLTPPPRETYSLNRKLSGAFLLAARLNATVDTRALWEKVVRDYQFDDDEDKSV
ncbi:ABC1 family-domain-containing protein [Schizophyllum amplum]|uniref:ABC1 family-domain-containing protein n=1 Tax=Schizophyllum amplum TaxID=97359 RepID=A0A550CHB1_9AGAR|nr:ABC1 family-domain-containing protein [Auriculariopsis ampla]